MSFSGWTHLKSLLGFRRTRPQRNLKQVQPTFEMLEERLPLSGDPLALTRAELMGVADAGVRRWLEIGLSGPQVEALNSISYQVRDLGGSNLAQAEGFQITIDDNAAGNLWFVDRTLDREEEFTNESPTLFLADAGTWADGKMDLLTVLMHEQGHILGLDGVFGASDDVMNEALQVGVRRLPTFGQAKSAVPGSMINPQYLTSDATGGGQPLSTIQPYNTLNYVIALEGFFPSQSLSNDPLLGSVEMFAATFAPRGFAIANGQLLQISQYPALFSILGTTYGGDGRTTFALPDLRGRVPIGAGQGPGLSNYALGEKSGLENVTLDINNLASHMPRLKLANRYNARLAQIIWTSRYPASIPQFTPRL